MYKGEKLQCPVEYDVGSPATAQYMSEVAQDIIDLSHRYEIDEILSVYKGELEEHYQDLIIGRPGHAAEIIARKTRSVGYMALAHCVHGGLAQQLNDAYRQGALEARLNLASCSRIDYSTNFVNGIYVHEADVFMQMLTDLLDDAYESISLDTESVNAQLFHAFESYAPKIRSMMDEAAAVSDNKMFRRYWSLTQTSEMHDYLGWSSLIDAVDNLLSCMLAVRSAVEEAGLNLTPYELGMYTRANLEVIASVAGVNKRAIGNILYVPHSDNDPVVIDPRDSNDVQRKYNSFFTKEDGSLGVRHASLQEGPWRMPGNCAAIPDLVSRDPAVTSAVNSFLTTYAPELVNSSDSYSSLTVSLIVASLVAERTVFRVSYCEAPLY